MYQGGNSSKLSTLKDLQHGLDSWTGSESKQRLETKVPIQMEKKKTLSVHKMSRRERNSHGRERLLKEGQYGHYEHTSFSSKSRASSSLSSLCLDSHI